MCCCESYIAQHLANLIKFHDDTGCAVAVRYTFINLPRDKRLTITRTHSLPSKLALHVSPPLRSDSRHEQLEDTSNVHH